MANMELPITLDEQVMMMKKYVSFRQRKKMKQFLEYAGYFRASRCGKYKPEDIEKIIRIYTKLRRCTKR